MRIARKHEGRLSCSVAAVSNKPSPLKPAVPKKQSASAKKQSCYRQVLNGKNSSAKPDELKRPLT